MRILIARYPVQASWLSFPFFYDKATRDLSEFADVENVVLADPDKPIGENLDVAPYAAVVSFGGRFTEACVEQASNLRIVAGFQCGDDVLESKGIPLMAEMAVDAFRTALLG